MGYVLGYHLFSLILYRVLPGEEAVGTELTSGGRLKYKFNSMSTLLFELYVDGYSHNEQHSHLPFLRWLSASRVRLLKELIFLYGHSSVTITSRL
jgi:Delta14-sterol reductase